MRHSFSQGKSQTATLELQTLRDKIQHGKFSYNLAAVHTAKTQVFALKPVPQHGYVKIYCECNSRFALTHQWQKELNVIFLSHTIYYTCLFHSCYSNHFSFLLHQFLISWIPTAFFYITLKPRKEKDCPLIISRHWANRISLSTPGKHICKRIFLVS